VTMGNTPTNSSTDMLLLPSPPAFGSSSPGSFMHLVPSIGGGGSSSGDLNSPTNTRSPASSGGFSVDSFGSGTCPLLSSPSSPPSAD
jgi:hypothetical protein